jgi:dihydrofolate reductase
VIISAVSINGVIGIGNEIPWYVPEDFKHYKETTIGHPVIVGLNTFRTLPEKALEGRDYLVLCGEGNLFENEKNNVHLFETMDDLMNYIKIDLIHYDDNIYVAGGAMIYDLFIDLCDECIITFINTTIKFEQNTVKFFPVKKLIKLFEPCNYDSTDWQTSKSKLEFRIQKYKKI